MLGPMPGVHDYRYAHLQRLVQVHGGQRAFADAAQLSPAYVSQIMTRRRNMGDKVARRTEQNLNLPPGSMDVPPDVGTDEPSQSQEPQVTYLQSRLQTQYEAAPREIRHAIDALLDESISEPARARRVATAIAVLLAKSPNPHQSTDPTSLQKASSSS
jgi:hypothetical protein